MNEHLESAETENPFCTRKVRPGAMAFLLPDGQSPADLVDRLRRFNWRGQIVGPHGSGKSTLLATLRPEVELAGVATLSVELHDGRRRLPLDWKRLGRLPAPALLIVDGYEQLGRLHRWRLKRLCRRRGLGLLVTAHADVGLPELFHTAATLELARAIVDRLQCEHRAHVTAEDVAEVFPRHGDNLRELLFELYDLYERRRRDG